MPLTLEAEAERAIEEARRHLASSAFEEAREAALGVIQYYPGASGSGEALKILALAELELGDIEGSVDAASRYLNLFDPLHPGFSEAIVVHSRALAAYGDPAASLANLLQFPEGAPEETVGPALELLRQLIGPIGLPDLMNLANDTAPIHPFGGVLATEVAVSLFLRGDTVDARTWAETARARGLADREEELVRGILAGNLEEVMGRPLILGTVLPRTGVSPASMEYGEWILEGVQVAVEEFQGELRRPIHLEVMDHQGDLQGTRASITSLEELGAIGAVGPLSLDHLDEAASARESGIPLISPFASLPPEEAPGVLSLSGPDPGGAEMVARYAWDLGLERVVILRPETEDARVHAEAFHDAFRTLGGYVPREVVYDSGATFFQAEFDEVGSTLPDGLFLPLSPRDIQLLAPQFTYYGLDTLGIQLLGTTGWTDDQVVLEVDSRHTDGVIASTSRLSQDETESFRRFRLRYEALFQRSLRSQIPAFGYDAAALLLLGLRENPRNSRELLRAMEGIKDFPGATGLLTVEAGRVRRDPHLVRIQNHELIYISSRFD